MANSEYKVIGTRPIRHDGVDKVTGAAKYGADVRLTGMLHGAIKRSSHAHAVIKGINTDKAAALPGVTAVMTGADLPAVSHEIVEMGEDSVAQDYLSANVMARDKVLFHGHPVAAVAAGLIRSVSGSESGRHSQPTFSQRASSAVSTETWSKAKVREPSTDGSSSRSRPPIEAIAAKTSDAFACLRLNEIGSSSFCGWVAGVEAL